jgi:site-specific DNA-methyltransferase (adenine-specific)
MKIDLRNGDCLELMKDIPDGSVDMVLTDPPYGTTACKWDSIIPLDPMWKELKRIIKYNGAIVLFGAQPFTSILISSNLKMFKYCWTWEKNNKGGYMNSKWRPLKKTEDIIVFSYGTAYSGGNLNNKNMIYNPQGLIDCNITETNSAFLNHTILEIPSRENGKKWTRNKKNYPDNLIKFDTEKGIHPTQKPVPLMEYLIKTYTNENETVLDFTMGSGTTGVACVNTNRNFIGFELDKEYFEIANKRINGE